jgi:hypothetical protein
MALELCYLLGGDSSLDLGSELDWAGTKPWNTDAQRQTLGGLVD